MSKTYIVTSDLYSISEAQFFAQKYNLEFFPERDTKTLSVKNDNIYVEFIDRQIFLSFYGEKEKISVGVNFSQLQKRSNYGSEALIRAVGRIPVGYQLYDLTAGLAKDSFVLASCGYNVVLLEKHPIIYASVKYAIEQLEGSKAARNMKIIYQDSIEFLDSIEKGNNVFYLDPMFSKVTKSKVKKDMQLLRKINAPELNIEFMLGKALQKGKKVILKTPINSPELIHFKPHHIIKGSKIKFSIFHKVEP